MANLQGFERAEYQQVKADLHRKILDRLDLEKLGRSQGDSARDEVLVVIRNAVNAEVVPLSFAEREKLSREILESLRTMGHARVGKATGNYPVKPTPNQIVRTG